MSDEDLILNAAKAEDAAYQDFRCPCGDALFEQIVCLSFKQNKVDKDKMMPTPAKLFRCLSCEGILYHKKDGGWGVMRRDPLADEKPQQVMKPAGPPGAVVKGPW